MAEKVKRLSLERDYASFLYYLDGDGNVCRMRKGKRPSHGQESARHAHTEVVVPHAIQRDNQYLYFIDRDGDIARSRRVGRSKTAA